MKKPRLLWLLTLPFWVQTVGATLLVGWLSFQDSQQSISRLAEQLMTSTSERIVENLTQYLARPVQINAQNQLLIQQRHLTLDRLADWEPLLGRQVELEPHVSFIKITNAAGEQRTGQKLENGDRRINVVAPETQFRFHSYTANRQGERQTLISDLGLVDVRQGSLYEETLAAGQRTWTSVFASFIEETLLIAISDPIYGPEQQDTSTRPVIGVMNTAVRLNSVSRFLQKLEIGQTGQAFIVERRPGSPGFLLATSTSEVPFRGEGKARVLFPVEESNDIVTRAVAQQLQAQFSAWGQIRQVKQFQAIVDQEPFFVRLEPLTDAYGLHWLVVVVVPESDFMGQIQAGRRRTLLLCVGATLLVGALGILTARWLERPLARLAEAAEALAQGKRTRRVEVDQTHTAEGEQVAIAFNAMAQQLQNNIETLEQRVDERTHKLLLEQQKTEALLLNILPAPIAQRLKGNPDAIAEYFENVTILFADIVDFTPLAEELPPLELVNLLNQIFSHFDQLADQLGLEKIKTIGDSYMVAAGLPIPRADHAHAMAEMALAMQAASAEFHHKMRRSFQIRIGINSGAVVAGVIGSRKFIYDLWGDAVNIAARMESHGEANRIQVTASTYEMLKDRYELQERGGGEVRLSQPPWLVGRKRGLL